MSFWAVCTAGFIHILLGLSLFLSQVDDACSPAPHLASYIFAVGVLLVAAKITLFSERYTHLPHFIQFLVETIGALVILEFCNLYVWCRLERLIYHATRLAFLSLGMNAKTYLKHEYWLLLVPTTAVATSFLFVTIRATKFTRKSLPLRRRINLHRNWRWSLKM